MTTDADTPAKVPDVEVPPQPTAGKFAWGTMLVVVAGMFMITLDFFIVNVAIPSTQSQLHASKAAIQFIVAGFGLAYAASMITGGRLGDLYGRRRMFAVGMAVFTLASAACGFAPSAGVLIVGRIVQGLGAALMSPQILAILNTSFVGAHRARAFTAFALSIGIGATFGQLIGGGLMSLDIAGLSWRTIFLINVPIGIVALLLVPRTVPESRGNGRTGLDLVGMLLVSAGLVAIVLPLVEGRQQGWPLWSWLCLIAAVPLLAAFAAYQRRLERTGRAPLMSLGLFRERSFAVGIAIILVFFSSMASFFLVLALYLQEGHGLSPLTSGLIFAATGLGYFISSIAAPAMAGRMGRQVLSVGALVVAAGYALLVGTVAEIGVTGPAPWLMVGLFVAGFGMGMVMMPVTPTVLAGVAPDHAAAAAGVLSTAQEGGNALGVAVIGVVFFGALGAGQPIAFGHAFQWSLTMLAGLTLVVAALVQLLPKPTQAA
ncbi:MAG TPA: MFS transporter [Pseudonocardiaceae bacterium]